MVGYAINFAFLIKYELHKPACGDMTTDNDQTTKIRVKRTN